MYMIQTFRIMKGIDDLEASEFFTMNTRETGGDGIVAKIQDHVWCYHAVHWTQMV